MCAAENKGRQGCGGRVASLAVTVRGQTHSSPGRDGPASTGALVATRARCGCPFVLDCHYPLRTSTCFSPQCSLIVLPDVC